MRSPMAGAARFLLPGVTRKERHREARQYSPADRLSGAVGDGFLPLHHPQCDVSVSVRLSAARGRKWIVSTSRCFVSSKVAHLSRTKHANLILQRFSIFRLHVLVENFLISRPGLFILLRLRVEIADQLEGFPGV